MYWELTTGKNPLIKWLGMRATDEIPNEISICHEFIFCGTIERQRIKCCKVQPSTDT